MICDSVDPALKHLKFQDLDLVFSAYKDHSHDGAADLKFLIGFICLDIEDLGTGLESDAPDAFEALHGSKFLLGEPFLTIHPIFLSLERPLLLGKRNQRTDILLFLAFPLKHILN